MTEGEVRVGWRGEIIRTPDPVRLAEAAAAWLADRLAATPGPLLRIALSGGETPRLLYETLTRPPCAARMPWERIALFWGDERFVPPDHPASNFGMVQRTLLAHAPIPPHRIHPFPTTLESPEAAAEAYARTLQAAYGGERLIPGRALFDVVLLGLGEDGHIASLLPGDPLLAERERWVGVVRHGRPEIRLTLTLPPLESTRAALFLVSGARKRGILARLLAGGGDGTDSLPVLRYRPAGGLFWFVDADALPDVAAPSS